MIFFKQGQCVALCSVTNCLSKDSGCTTWIVINCKAADALNLQLFDSLCDTASNCMAGQNAWVATIEKPKHLSAHKELFVAPTQNYNLRSIPVFALKPTLFCIFNQVSLLGTLTWHNLTWQYIFLSSTNPHSIRSLCICHFIKLGNMRPSAVSSPVHVGPE